MIKKGKKRLRGKRASAYRRNTRRKRGNSMPSKNSLSWRSESHIPEVAGERDLLEKEAEKISEKVSGLAPSVQMKSDGLSKSSVSSSFIKSLNASKNSGTPLPESTQKSMSAKMGSNFKNVRIHKGTEADRLNKEIHSKAFTHGNDIYFKSGYFQPDSNEGQRLIAHELVHTRQQSNKIHREMEYDSRTNRPTGNFIFQQGPGLTRGFLRLARRLSGGNVLSIENLNKLRTYSIVHRGSVSHAEKLLMAAYLDPALVPTIQSGGSRFTLAMANISKANLATVRDLGKSTMPAEIVQMLADADQAIHNFDFLSFFELANQLHTASTEAIFNEAGPRHRTAAADLIVFSERNGIPLPHVLSAMINGASDNSQWDKIMAGMTYAVVEDAQHPDSNKIKNGDLKVDALSPGAFERNLGSADAAYTSMGHGDMEKGDTIYLKTTFNIRFINARALMYHEFVHAVQDHDNHGAVRMANQLDTEVAAYRAQMRYTLEQILRVEESGQQSMIDQIAVNFSLGVYRYAMLLEAKTNLARYQDLVLKIFQAHDASYTPMEVSMLLSLPNFILVTMLKTALVDTGVYSATAEIPQDGARGESAANLVNR